MPSAVAKITWAHQVKQLFTVDYLAADTVVLVMDNLDTHTIGSLFESFAAEEAFALARRRQIHHAPKHGSWLSIAEIELSAMTRRCLNWCLDDLDVPNTEFAAWQAATNADQREVGWQFATDDAGTKLQHLYPNTTVIFYYIGVRRYTRSSCRLSTLGRLWWLAVNTGSTGDRYGECEIPVSLTASGVF